LFETGTADPVIFVAVSAIFAVIGALAAYWPAHRAMRVDPMIALRAE
jgi:ABC-type antimicrobial peptide transport system permease subunit